MPLRDLLHPLEKLEALDPAADWLSTRINDLVGGGPLKSLLSGTWLGHPLHAMLTDLPIGLWSAGMVLDAVGGEELGDAADTVIVAGILSALPTAAAGLSDWADTYGPERRVGMAHALANIGALSLFSASVLLRRSGARGTGKVLSALGYGAVTAGGYLGGHLSYGAGVGVDHNAFEEAPEDWVRVARDADIAEGSPQLVTAEGFGVLLYRRGGALHAIADRCSHAGGPLHEGEVDASLCVTCPWHGSRFRLTDGSVAAGPATAPQRILDARVVDGHIEVRAVPS